MPYPAYVPSCGLPPQDRQAQRRRAGHFKLHTYGCAGWRHKCLIRPTFLPAGSPPGPASAAPPGGRAPYLRGVINSLSLA
ncbi:hypothetical protein D0899_00255 [Klebsiella pneumoniae]|nr:hypothetical protein D0899_00255 [Klebsiella pneumoniae]